MVRVMFFVFILTLLIAVYLTLPFNRCQPDSPAGPMLGSTFKIGGCYR